MAEKNLSAHAFERRCGIANGYLGKQLKSKGAVGSEILEKIHQQYADINLSWLLTGEGSMLLPLLKNAGDKNGDQLVEEETSLYEVSSKNIIALLRKQVALLEKANADKDKIITLLESALQDNKDVQ